MVNIESVAAGQNGLVNDGRCYHHGEDPDSGPR